MNDNHRTDCNIPRCKGVHYAKGWCEAHYTKNRRYGTPTPDHGESKRNKGRPMKRYHVAFDPTYTFPLNGSFSDMNVKAGLERGVWPKGLIFKDVWVNKYYRVEQHLKNIGHKAEAEKRIVIYRVNAGENEDLLGVRHDYYWWSVDQLIDEIIRLGKKCGEIK